mgnify:CR=1 FL=1|tara:strand:- start:3177 stop:3434 length:258 start_codon:yes stop_codon:yes gene_type:complete
MPRYLYLCEKCLKKFEVNHSYKITQTECILCGGQECVKKHLSSPVKLTRKTKKLPQKKPGTIVEETIEENKRELQKEKQKLSKKR